jgi:hypothetical protein
LLLRPQISSLSLTIKICGMGEPELHEYFDSLPPAEQDEIRRAVQRLERCSALDIGPLDHMPIKGHA